MNAVARPPGPKSLHPLGQFLPFRRDVLGFLTQVAREHGDVAFFALGSIKVVLLSHPDHVREVLTTHNRHVEKGRPLRLAKHLLGEGLLTSEGAFHARQSRIVSPVLHPQRLQGYGTIVTDYAERAHRTWRDGATVDMRDEMVRLAVAIAGKTMFHWEMDSGAAAGVQRALDDALSIFDRVTVPFAELLLKIPLPGTRRFLRARAHLDAAIYGLIESRRRDGQDHGDLLSMLLAAQDSEGDGGRMTDKQVRDEALTLFLTAFDTVSLTLTWTWYVLAQHPEVETALHAELDRVLGGRTPTVDDLAKLPYLRMVITETLRLYPPAWATAREVCEEFSVGGYTMPVGTLILMSQWVVQRDPRWFANPEACLPERWDHANDSRPPRFSYFPFGGGSRGCIGQNYGLQEAALIMATMVQHWHVRLVAEKPVVLQPLINLRPRDGMPMILQQHAPLPA
ncbi:MAG: cytochrome P450 [Gemmatimonadales bacterium]